MFPGKSAKQVLPLNSLWSLRVWLRVDGVDHQLFKVDDLFVGKDLDFNSIGDASFARHAGQGQDYQVYKGYVGKALITFTVRYVVPYRVCLLITHWDNSDGTELGIDYTNIPSSTKAEVSEIYCSVISACESTMTPDQSLF